jgi:hypothetical protein
MQQREETQEEKAASAVDYLAYMFYIIESKQATISEREVIRAWQSLSKQVRESYMGIARVTLAEIESILNG